MNFTSQESPLLIVVQHFLSICNLINDFPNELMHIIIQYYSLRAIVYCTGSRLTKIGFAGSNRPEYTFPSIIGRPTLCINKEILPTDIVIGDEAQKQKQFLQCSYPIQNPLIHNWTDMQLLWNYSFYQNIQNNTSKVLLTEPILNPFENRRKMYEHMFTKYGFDAVMVVPQQVLVLYSQGLLTGVVLDSGDSVTHSVPIYEGYVLPMVVQRLSMGGRHVTRELYNLLHSGGYVGLNRSADWDIFTHIKEETGYVAFDVEMERKIALETTTLMKRYELPDGRVINVNRERFEAFEVMFEPWTAGFSALSIDNILFRSVMKCDIDLRHEMFTHIVLSGGNTMFYGLSSRLEKELKKRWLRDRSDLTKFRLKIEEPARKENMIFLGGSVLADIMENEKEFWLFKDDYYEKGTIRAVKEHHNIV